MRISQLANNQVIIKDGTREEFHSYGTRIAVTDQHAPTRLDPKWDYSNTTRKYCGQFLGGLKKADILKKIKSGEFIVENLNP
jgi:hypothetical protein